MSGFSDLTNPMPFLLRIVTYRSGVQRNPAMKKAYAKTGRVCRVTFAVQPEGHVQNVAVCGEFNGWDPAAHHMKRQKDGRFTVTLSLPVGKAYRFRYLVDGACWANDPTADASVPNPFGSEDSVIQV